MRDIGEFMRQFREVQSQGSRSGTHSRTVTQDYQSQVSRFLDGQLSPTQRPVDLKHDAFGLPIQYRSPSRGGTAILLWERVGESGDRRGSPLFLRPIKFQERQYGLICLLMESQFLPNGAREKLSVVDRSWRASRPKPRPVYVEPASLDILHAFLNALGRRYSKLGELP